MNTPRKAIAAALLATTLPATAQELGDPVAGRDFAAAMCADCHAVGPEDAGSPDKSAPSFKSVADMTSTTRTSLVVWFQSSHPTMPNIKLSDDEVDDVIAYILSLRQP
jgi:mono/diheme cytochrome c family protein